MTVYFTGSSQDETQRQRKPDEDSANAATGEYRPRPTSRSAREMPMAPTPIRLLNVAIAAAFLVASMLPAMAATTANWIDAAPNDNYSDGDNWDIGIPPCNGVDTYDVVIPAAAGVVVVDVSGCSVDTLALGVGSTLQISASYDLTVDLLAEILPFSIQSIATRCMQL